jgi:hypothetical protein
MQAKELVGKKKKETPTDTGYRQRPRHRQKQKIFFSLAMHAYVVSFGYVHAYVVSFGYKRDSLAMHAYVVSFGARVCTHTYMHICIGNYCLQWKYLVP